MGSLHKRTAHFYDRKAFWQDSARHNLANHQLEGGSKKLTEIQNLLNLYEQTIIEIFLNDGTTYRTTPKSQSQELWPFTSDTVYVVTAWNPKSKLLSLTENRNRNKSLLRELSIRNLDVLPARGTSLDGLWFEESFAVTNLQGEDLAWVGTQFEQNAIFELKNKSVRLIPYL